MIVVRAEILGFCKGVRRAVEIALQACIKQACVKQSSSSYASSNSPVYTLGPLIHNSRVLESLAARGVVCLEETELPPENSTVIIRAHGITPQAERELRRRGLRVLDATCPHVKASQNKARNYAKNGCRIFLAGEKNHGELAGIVGYVEDALSGASASACFIAGNSAEAAAAASALYNTERGAKTALIAQTTISAEEFSSIGEGIREYFPLLEVSDTICAATADRQRSLRALCAKVDAVIIAGSRESANTRRLLSLAESLAKPAWLVERSAELPPGIGAYKTVGLSAGASAPDELIDEIESALKAL